MYDLKMEGKKSAPTWFWISLGLIIIGSIILYVIFNNDNRGDQINTEKKTTFQQVQPGYEPESRNA